MATWRAGPLGLQVCHCLDAIRSRPYSWGISPKGESMSFKSFLSAFGAGMKKVASVAVPVAEAASPYINLFAPGVGTAINLAASTVGTIEQKYAASNASSGSGAQKLADAVAIAGPAMAQLMAQEGI